MMVYPTQALRYGWALGLLLAGCDVVLDLEEPKLREPPTSLNPSSDPDAGIDDEPCEDGSLRCQGSTSPNRFECSEGKWVVYAACAAGEQCDSAKPEICTPLGGESGEPCTTPDKTACVAAASRERRYCDPVTATWTDVGACAEGEACDRTDGSCRPIVRACIGREPDAAVCDGSTRHICGQDLTTSKEHECQSAAHCQQSRGKDCAVCTEAEHSCSGRTLSVCNAARDGWAVIESCSSAALCNEVAGQCTSAACRSNQAICDADQLMICSDDRSRFDPVMQCMPELCDAGTAQCDLCAKDSCEDTTTQRICSSDGQRVSSRACPAEQRFCVGDGNCVECGETADCPTPSDCRTVACSSNRCESSDRGAGTLCDRDRGECDGNGACVPLQPPTVSSITPSAGQQGTRAQATIGGEHLAHAVSVRFTDVAGISAELARGGDASELPVEISVGDEVAPGAYAFEVTTSAGSVTNPAVTFQVTLQPLQRLAPSSGAVGTIVEIHAKPGQFIHLPGLAPGSEASNSAAPDMGAALGTTVLMSEDGSEAQLPAIVAEPSPEGGQALRVTIPARQGSWAETEIVSVLVTYRGPSPLDEAVSSGVLEFTYAP